MKLRKKTILSFFVSICMLCTIIPINAYAAPDKSLYFNMPNGGTWTHKTWDPNTTKDWNRNDWATAKMFRTIEFIPPKTVQAIANDLGIENATDNMLEPIKYLIETACSYGIEYAKKEAVKKFGQVLATKVISFLNVFGWAYIAYDVLSTVVAGRHQNFYATAAKKGTGVIIIDGALWGCSYYWDGSSEFGSYPTAILGPNKYQFGDVKTN